MTTAVPEPSSVALMSGGLALTTVLRPRADIGSFDWVSSEQPFALHSSKELGS